jgi:hypothetical protein
VIVLGGLVVIVRAIEPEVGGLKPDVKGFLKAKNP